MGRQAVADVLVDRAAAHVVIEGVMPPIAKATHAVRVKRHFPRRKDANGIDFGDGALAVGVECSQAVHFVVEKIDANWMRAPHRENVEQRAPRREFAPFRYRVGGAIAGRREALALARWIEGLTDGEH